MSTTDRKSFKDFLHVSYELIDSLSAMRPAAAADSQFLTNEKVPNTDVNYSTAIINLEDFLKELRGHIRYNKHEGCCCIRTFTESKVENVYR
jgi:hypothetical protein